MRRTGLSEQEVLGVALRLAEAWADIGELPPKLDAIGTESLVHLTRVDVHDDATIRAVAMSD